MLLSVDFGGSTIDLIKWEGGTPSDLRSFEVVRTSFPQDIEGFFREANVELSDVEEIKVTGGKSQAFIDSVKGVPVRKIDEIEAIGLGGRYLMGDKAGGDVLVVSMGTGTCMVQVRDGECEHVGGTGVGGGTFLGLSRLVLKETDIEKLRGMFKKGDRNKVDLSVQDIIGGGIGLIGPDVTASNLGKLSREIDFSQDDLAAGIANLIGQTIATAAVFAAKAMNCKDIVLIGKLTKIEKITDTIFNIADIYGMKMHLPRDSEYGSAIGAGVS